MNTKTFYITVMHSQALQYEYILAELPEYFTADAVHQCICKYAKKNYKVNVVRTLPTWHGFDEISCWKKNSIEEIIELLEHVKLYKKVTHVHKRKETVIEETRDFRLSACFTISEVSVCPNIYGYVNGMTFFNVINPLEVKDVIFDDKDLKKTLECGKAKNGRYFLYGKWKFYRSKSKPSYWRAEKYYIRETETGRTEEIVEI